MEAALVILDGWGLGPTDDPAHRNAVATAETPVVDRLFDAGATGTLTTSGRSVGLPQGEAGNSEVGHLTIGAGRAIDQALTRIEDAIADGSFFDNETLGSAYDHARKTGGRVHLVGLVSDGGVHAHERHLHALIRLAADREVPAVTHVITDGRDTPPTAAKTSLSRLETVIDENGTGAVATVSGRYYAMDRDEHWDRTHRTYEAIVDHAAAHRVPTAEAAVEAAYDRDETDEFIEPTVIADEPPVVDGDVVLCFNYRADRMRQLVRMVADIDPVWPFETDPPTTRVVTMTEYDERFDLPVVVHQRVPESTLGEVLAIEGRTQLRIAETEKYAHVTYFLNGGREVEFDGEIREIVPSPEVPTYDKQPEMSAPAVTDRAIEILDADDPDVLVLNYANPDMVGHTGDFAAAVEAVETVDAQVGRLVRALSAHGAHVLVTADHGNADDMGTAENPHTAHTTNPVPVVYLAPDETDGGRDLRTGGTLADVAPTILSLLGIERPAVMTGTSLLEPAPEP